MSWHLDTIATDNPNIPITPMWKMIQEKCRHRKMVRLYNMFCWKMPYERNIPTREEFNRSVRQRYADDAEFRKKVIANAKKSRARKMQDPEYRNREKQQHKKWLAKTPTMILRIKLALALSSYIHSIELLREYGIDADAIYRKIGKKPSKEHHLDHIIPCAAFDFSKREDIAKANSPENFQWISKTENMQKGARWEKDGIAYLGKRRIRTN
jgi:hypothetical protein